MYGQGGNDTMHGNGGDDYMEGNSGRDTMYGDADDDDMAGGSGHDNGGNGGDFRELANVLDDNVGGVGDTMHGGDGVDYVAGDNASLTRPGGVNSYNGSAKRDVKLYDVQILGGPDIDERASGDDTMTGDGDDDVMFGQGDNDAMHGNDNDDYMEGNHADDTMHGDAGQDDMTGGGSATDGVITYNGEFDPGRTADGLLDGDDTMYGDSDDSEGDPDGDGADVMLGDNGVIARPLDAGGQWVQNSFNGNIKRVVRLADVEMVSNALDEGLSGDDKMWGSHNDDIMYGQGGQDEMHGGAGHDYMEGNAASDTMHGDGGEDDMLGGTGPTTNSSQLSPLSDEDRATALPDRTDVSTAPKRTVPLGTGLPLPTEEVPLGDEMYGGEGADVMLGDNGIIIRPLEAGQWITLRYDRFLDHIGDVAPRHPTDRVNPGDEPSGSRIDRSVEMLDGAPGLVAGSDLMFGGPGDDDMYGQFDDTDQTTPAIGDEMHGEEGEDAMAGDQGVFDNRVLAVGSQQHIEPKEPFIDDDIFIDRTLFREFIQDQIPAVGGNDRMRGGPGGDWMHGGAGEDVMNGDDGNDRLFGGDGDDDMWGGRHHDHLWGGFGADQLDLHPRVEEGLDPNDPNTVNDCDPLVDADPPDPAEWYEFGFEGGLATTTCDGNFEDIDYIYGGWEADAMQANVGDNGPRIGDRLMDWAGVYNLFVLCPATYGEFVSTRESSPHMTDFIHRLAEGDGALQPGPEGEKGAPTHESGFNEIGFVYKKDIKFNSHPPYEGTPAHFTCTVDSTTMP
jgi:Ca2+-binding RTX toxin-like protein